MEQKEEAMYIGSIEHYRKRARRGDERAQLILFFLLFHQIGNKEKKKESRKWLKESSRRGNIAAEAMHHFVGLKKEPDYFWALQKFEEHSFQAKEDSFVSLHMLGYSYKEGKGVSKDSRQAIKYFSESAKRGNYHSEFQVALILKKAKDEQWKKVVRNLVDNGNSLAMTCLASELIERGDYEAAWGLLERARAEGSVRAVEMEGMMMMNGKKYEEAYRLFCLARDLGSFEILSSLGLCLMMGRGCEKDISRGLEVIEKAAARNDGRALFVLYVLHATGKYVEKNEKKALASLEHSAMTEYVHAVRELSMHFVEGSELVERNEEEAASWMEKGCEMQDRWCLSTYGRMLVEGDVLVKDVHVGREYLQKAAKMGCKKSEKVLNELDEKDKQEIARRIKKEKERKEMDAEKKKEAIEGEETIARGEEETIARREREDGSEAKMELVRMFCKEKRNYEKVFELTKKMKSGSREARRELEAMIDENKVDERLLSSFLVEEYERAVKCLTAEGSSKNFSPLRCSTNGPLGEHEMLKKQSMEGMEFYSPDKYRPVTPRNWGLTAEGIFSKKSSLKNVSIFDMYQNLPAEDSYKREKQRGAKWKGRLPEKPKIPCIMFHYNQQKPSVKVEWKKEQYLEYYKLYMRVEGKKEEIWVNESEKEDCKDHFFLTDFKHGCLVSFSLSAVNSVGEGKRSEWVHFRIPQKKK